MVEVKCGNGEWTRATEVPAGQLTATVDGLKEGQNYAFRIKVSGYRHVNVDANFLQAINKAGESAPSDPSRTITAKTRRVPPKIDRSALVELRVKRDGIVEFNVPVSGDAQNMKFQWLLNDAPLSSSERTKVDNSTENLTRLRTLSAERNDGGTYKLIATNEYGKDGRSSVCSRSHPNFCRTLEAEVVCVVLDTPTAPRSMDCHDTTANSTTVKWLKPSDDGGSPITSYQGEFFAN